MKSLGASCDGLPFIIDKGVNPNDAVLYVSP